MNGSGVFSIDAPIVLFLVYFFNGGIFLTLGGLVQSVVMLLRPHFRRAGFVALGLVPLPLIYFYMVTALASIIEGSPPDAVYMIAVFGILATALASLLYGVIVMNTQKRGPA